MPRYIRNVALTAKIETIRGQDAAPSAATDGIILVDQVEMTPLDIKYAERNVFLPYFGKFADLVATYSQKLKFSVDASLSGTAGAAPLWGKLMTACASSEASLTAPARVEYTPASQGLKTTTLYFYDDGALHKLVGSMGSFTLKAPQGGKPVIEFEFWGIYTPLAVQPIPAVSLAAWKVPLTVNLANTNNDITLGCTYAAGAISGGTTFNSMGLEIMANKVGGLFAGLSEERIDITDHDFQVKFELELDAAQEVAAQAAVLANAPTGMGFRLGKTAGNSLLIFAPALVRNSISKSEKDGVRMISFGGTLQPSSGNDDVRFVAL